MSIDIRPPCIQGSDREQLAAIRTYLFQLRDQLQFAFDNVGEGGVSTVIERHIASGSASSPTLTPEQKEENAEATFNSIKALIIKSADIVDAYYEEINKKFNSEYFAESDFGSYLERTESNINANAEGITQTNEKVAAIEYVKDVYQNSDAYAMIVKGEGYIKSGFLGVQEDGVELYGIEVGQTVTENGTTTFRGSARFTPMGVFLFDENGIKTAWLGQRRFSAYEIEARESLQVGGFIDKVKDTDVITKYVG